MISYLLIDYHIYTICQYNIYLKSIYIVLKRKSGCFINKKCLLIKCITCTYNRHCWYFNNNLIFRILVLFFNYYHIFCYQFYMIISYNHLFNNSIIITTTINSITIFHFKKFIVVIHIIIFLLFYKHFFSSNIGFSSFLISFIQ